MKDLDVILVLLQLQRDNLSPSKVLENRNEIETLLEFALDFKHGTTLTEGFVKLYHSCEISDSPRLTDYN